MNAPANIPLPQRIRLDELPIEATYRHAISIHCPNIDEMEMAARVDLAGMRDAAMAGFYRASPSAQSLLREVSNLAMNAVYAPLPTSRLLHIRAALKLTMMAAREIERVQRDG